MNMNIILSSGKCSIEDGSRVCTCTGNYYGTQCQLDGEVMLAYFFVMFIVLLFGGSACTFLSCLLFYFLAVIPPSTFFFLCAIMTQWSYPSIIYSLTGPFFCACFFVFGCKRATFLLQQYHMLPQFKA